VGDSLIDCLLTSAPRRAQTGHDSLSVYSAPQIGQARLPFVFNHFHLARATSVLVDLASDCLHKIHL
jgi:hypothetical protein